MIAELMLGGILAAAGGAAAYLSRDWKRAQDERIRIAKEERILRENATTRAKANFRELVITGIRKSPTWLNLAAIAEESGIHDHEVVEVTQQIYASRATICFSDGVMTLNERGRLNQLALLLKISAPNALSIESDIRRQRYQTAVVQSLADGTISSEDSTQLDELRNSLRIGQEEAIEATADLAVNAYIASIERIVRAGVLSTSEQGDLQRLKLTLAGGSLADRPEVRARALDLFRQAYAVVVQDGEVTPNEERLLKWLQREVGLRNEEVAAYLDEIGIIQKLAGLRRGELPSLSTTKLLERGELCHWESDCVYYYETTRATKDVEGSLLVTSQRNRSHPGGELRSLCFRKF